MAGCITALVALPVAGTDLGPLAMTCVPVAVLVGLVLANLPARARNWRQILLSGVAFGLSLALGGVLLYLLVAMAAALLPGSTVARPEGPLGYVAFFVISLLSLTPFVAIGTSGLGLVWASAVRFIGHSLESRQS
jgi:hypothetical protein